MTRGWILVALAAPSAALFAMAGCGEDEIFAPTKDAGTVEAGPVPDGSITPPADAGDAAAPKSCTDVTGQPRRLLVTMNNASTSELVAFDLAAKTSSGAFTYPGFLGAATSDTDPYVLGQSADVVYRMKGNEPWTPISSWNVAGDDKIEGGVPFADPVGMIVPYCKKGYVLRYTRNKILVVDTTQSADAGAPIGQIDLGSLVQTGDQDGFVEATSAVFVPSKKRVYVLLGNVDKKKITPQGVAFCATTKPSIVAIDPETDQLVNLGGKGPGGGILLEGYNPSFGVRLDYDAALDRLVVLSSGCNLEETDGAPGAVNRRRVEEVQLATGTVRTLLSLDDKGYPSMVYVDATRAAIGFFGSAFFWNPQENKLGAALPGAPDFMSYDGQGNIVGPRATFVDGGPGPVEVVSVPLSSAGMPDASVQKLGELGFKDPTGFVGGSEVWPRP